MDVPRIEWRVGVSGTGFRSILPPE